MKTMLLALLASTVLASAGLAETLRIGTSANFTPWESVDPTAEIIGFDRDVADEICKRVAAECTFANQTFDGLLPGLQVQKFDLVVFGVSITRIRLAIARALCMKPKVMLCDEPTSAPDPEMVQEVPDVMTHLSKEGLTVFVATHEMGFARNVADRIVFMDGGVIVEQGSPKDFLDNPQQQRTRDFLRQIGPRH